ncbi:MAG: sulfite exporter TauE/SafE family protein [Gemmatimonadaceae bacterium]
MSLAIGVLIASLLGSVHCAAMCGGFVCVYAGTASSGFRVHLAYNAGRLLSYLALGALAGALGASFNRVGAIAGISRTAAMISGALMIAWGVATLLAARGHRVPRIGAAVLTGRRNPLGAILARARGQSASVRAGLTGLLTTLLPCGWLYAFVAAAAGTGRVDHAVVMMTFFWLGTLPMMLTAGYGMQRLSGPLRTRLPMVTAMAVVIMGVLSMSGKMRAAPRAFDRLSASTISTRPARHEHH